MHIEDRQVLFVVSKLNSEMGAIVLALLNSPVDGRLSPEKLHNLASICDDMSALLDNHAERIERATTVIDSEI